jgi:hypothetical protein
MALALSKEKVQAQHGLMMFYSLIILFVTNALVLLIANSLFPTHLVLGSMHVPYWWALYHSMFKLTVIDVFAMAFVTYYEWKKGVIFTPKQWMITYFVVDLVALWGITRFAEYMGLGVSSIFVLIIFAAVLDFIQGMAMLALGKTIKM